MTSGGLATHICNLRAPKSPDNMVSLRFIDLFSSGCSLPKHFPVATRGSPSQRTSIERPQLLKQYGFTIFVHDAILAQNIFELLNERGPIQTYTIVSYMRAGPKTTWYHHAVPRSIVPPKHGQLI